MADGLQFPTFSSDPAIQQQFTSFLSPLFNMSQQFQTQQLATQAAALKAQEEERAAASNPQQGINPTLSATLNPFAPNISNTSPMNPFAHHLNEGWGPSIGGQASPMGAFNPAGAQQQASPANPSGGLPMAPGSVF